MRRILIRPLVWAGWAALSLLPACAAHPGSPRAAWRNPKDGMLFVGVPAGSLTVQVCAEPTGVGDPERIVPQEVTFPRGFWLGRTEVTVGQFQRFVRETGYVTDAEKGNNRFTWQNPGFRQQPSHPVVYVSYNDARSYVRWAGVDVPTEAEWLYACRAGTTTRFYWGDRRDDRYAWHRGNTLGLGTRPVAGRRPNAWGLYDMVGNAWEYCRVGDSNDGFVLRGGSWTRCPEYRMRDGTLSGDLLAEAVEPRLQPHDLHPEYAAYPWDDDRGFRCILRMPKGPCVTTRAESGNTPGRCWKESGNLICADGRTVPRSS